MEVVVDLFRVFVKWDVVSVSVIVCVCVCVGRVLGDEIFKYNNLQITITTGLLGIVEYRYMDGNLSTGGVFTLNWDLKVDCLRTLFLWLSLSFAYTILKRASSIFVYLHQVAWKEVMWQLQNNFSCTIPFLVLECFLVWRALVFISVQFSRHASVRLVGTTDAISRYFPLAWHVGVNIFDRFQVWNFYCFSTILYKYDNVIDHIDGINIERMISAKLTSSVLSRVL